MKNSSKKFENSFYNVTFVQRRKNKMEELIDLIQHVSKRSLELKSELTEKVKELALLQEELSILHSEKANFTLRIEGLERELAHVKEIQSSESKKIDFNERIDELVREIDECVHQLKQ